MKVSELEGAALELWVARALGLRAIPGEPDGFFYWKEGIYDASGWFAPSTDWAQGGPIVEREGISIVSSDTYSGKWRAGMVIWLPDHDDWHYGETALVAAMRCLVASKYGDAVPDA